MLKHVNADDLRMMEWLKIQDPFQLAPPVYQHYTFHALPPEVVKIEVKEKNIMPIRIVEEKDAPARASKRGVVSSTSDWNDVMVALRSPAKPNSAMVVAMTESEWKEVKKPEITFGYALRRYFESKGLPLTAYQSGKLEVTIRKETSLDKNKKK